MTMHNMKDFDAAFERAFASFPASGSVRYLVNHDMDGFTKTGVAVELRINGKMHRHAVLMPHDGEIDAAMEILRSWADGELIPPP